MMGVVRLSEVLRPRLIPLANGPKDEKGPVFSVRPPSDALQEARLDLILQMREELGIKDEDLTLKEDVPLERDFGGVEAASSAEGRAAGAQEKAKRLLAEMKFPDIVKSIKFNNALENLDILHSIVWTDTLEPAFPQIADVRIIDRDLKTLFLTTIKLQRERNGELGESKPDGSQGSISSTGAGSSAN